MEEREIERSLCVRNLVVEVLDLKDIARRETDEKSSARCLLFTLTDGKLIFKAMEYQGFESFPNTLNVGAKLMLVGPFEFKRKTALLCAHNLILLGTSE